MGSSKKQGSERGLWIRRTRGALVFRGFRSPSAGFGLFPLWVSLCFLLLNFSGPYGDVAFAHPPASVKDEVKRAIKKMSGPIGVVLSKNDFSAIQATLEKALSESEKEGKPVRFGVGVLDRDGLAVAGRYTIGSFKMEDFSRYNFFARVVKQKKILQDRLYFQGGSELLIICVPLIQKKAMVGALVFGFDPSQIQKDYVLTTEQFMALDFNQ